MLESDVGDLIAAVREIELHEIPEIGDVLKTGISNLGAPGERGQSAGDVLDGGVGDVIAPIKFNCCENTFALSSSCVPLILSSCVN